MEETSVHGHLILAVDGGGTSTSFSVYSFAEGALRLKCRVSGGPTSHKATSESQANRNMQDGLIRLAAEGYMPDCFDIASFGLSGMDTPNDERPYRDMVNRAPLPLRKNFRKTVICSDALLPLYAENESWGIALIAGTGSVALALDGNGILHRTGGWGYGISDTGSGQWIGAEAVAYALQLYDRFGDAVCTEDPKLLRKMESAGLRPKRPIDPGFISEILKAAGCRSLGDLARWTSDMQTLADTAELAKTVIHSESRIAKDIVFHAAEALAMLCAGAASMLSKKENADLPVVLSGGIFNAELPRKLTSSMIKDALGGNVRILVSGHDPSYGAAMLGVRVLNGETEPPLFTTSMFRADGRWIKGSDRIGKGSGKRR